MKIKKIDGVDVDKDKLRACLLQMGFQEEYVDGHTESFSNGLHAFVAKKYQEDLDYFLDHREMPNNVVSQKIKYAMEQLRPYPCYFDALILVSAGVGADVGENA